MQSDKTECSVTVQGTLAEVQDTLQEQQRRFEKTKAPVMLEGPYKEGPDKIVCCLKHVPVPTKRVPNELCRGEVVGIKMPSGRGVRVVFRLNEFPAQELFWQTVDGLLIELGVATDVDRLLSDRFTMRQFYEDYNPVTAKEIAEAMPKAWEVYCYESGRWGAR